MITCLVWDQLCPASLQLFCLPLKSNVFDWKMINNFGGLKSSRGHFVSIIICSNGILIFRRWERLMQADVVEEIAFLMVLYLMIVLTQRYCNFPVRPPVPHLDDFLEDYLLEQGWKIKCMKYSNCLEQECTRFVAKGLHSNDALPTLFTVLDQDAAPK